MVFYLNSGKPWKEDNEKNVESGAKPGHKEAHEPQDKEPNDTPDLRRKEQDYIHITLSGQKNNIVVMVPYQVLISLSWSSAFAFSLTHFSRFWEL